LVKKKKVKEHRAKTSGGRKKVHPLKLEGGNRGKVQRTGGPGPGKNGPKTRRGISTSVFFDVKCREICTTVQLSFPRCNAAQRSTTLEPGPGRGGGGRKRSSSGFYRQETTQRGNHKAKSQGKKPGPTDRKPPEGEKSFGNTVKGSEGNRGVNSSSIACWVGNTPTGGAPLKSKTKPKRQNGPPNKREDTCQTRTKIAPQKKKKNNEGVKI